MACAANQTYASFNLAASVTGQNQTYEMSSQSYIDNIALQSISVFGCAMAKSLLLPGGSNNHLFQVETSLAVTVTSLSVSDFAVVNNPLGEQIGTSVFVDGVNIGVFATTTAAPQTITYTPFGAQPAFPLILGVNCGDIKVTTNSSTTGAWIQWTSAPGTIDRLTSIDYEKWWCCAGVAAGGCTNGVGCGGGGNHPLGSFLLPTSSNPDPVAAQSTTPILNTPLYLSNHTFALTNNFGVTK